MQFTISASVAFAILASIAHSAPVAKPQDYSNVDWSAVDWSAVDWNSVFSTPAAAPATAAPATSAPAAVVTSAPVVEASTPVATAAPATTPEASTTVAAVATTPAQAPSSTAAAPTTSSSSSSSGSSSSGGKRGLAFNDAGLLSQFTSSAITWAYNWGSSCSQLSGDWTFVPMLWGTGSDHTNSWQSDATNAISSGSQFLLGFNEPDMPAQSNLSPTDAATAWGTYMEPFAGKAKLGAPAVTNSGSAGQGLDWLSQFLSACSSCTVDFVPIHWYETGVTDSNLDDFKQHVTDAITAANGKPVWITEFGLFGASDDQQASFLSDASAWLDSQSGVENYAYFGALQDILVDDSGALTAVGQVYDS